METLRTKPFIGLIAAMLVTACVGFAHSWSWHKSSDRTTDVTFSSPMKFTNGKTLPAGTYQMEVPENSPAPIVRFSQDGNVKATSKARLVSQEKKNPYTEVDSTQSGHRQLVTEIRPGGWNEVLLFSPARQNNSSKATQ
jgi:hypothetical protein